MFAAWFIGQLHHLAAETDQNIQNCQVTLDPNSNPEPTDYTLEVIGPNFLMWRQNGQDLLSFSSCHRMFNIRNYRKAMDYVSSFLGFYAA